jgi:DNA polymerase-3 subunit gamma/tau
MGVSTVSLFRKWRSQTFEDLVGQEAVVRTLRNALSSGSPARAYLFCGPRGTGKTSTARIFAKALNCARGLMAEPCNQCSLCRRIADGSCMDVLEIDAASHTQVDKIREFIVDKVHFAPAEARFKVYIIDEVHKLSTSSFNALLKTLEEPPAHVVFILATTHPQDLLPTILSRCQRHDFHRLTPLEIRDRLTLVAREEGFELDERAADILARSAEGSLRDALVQLEQVATFAGLSIGEEDVRTLLGLAGRAAMNDLVSAMAERDARMAMQRLDDLVRSGRDLGRLSNELVDHLRCLLLISVKAVENDLLGIPPEEMAELEEQASSLTPARIMNWLKAAMDLQGGARDAQRARLLWEMMLIRMTVPEVDLDPLEDLRRRVARLEAGYPAPRQGLPATAPAPSPPEIPGPPTRTGRRVPQVANRQTSPAAQPRAECPGPSDSSPSGRSPGKTPKGPPDAQESPSKVLQDLGWGESVRPAPEKPLGFGPSHPDPAIPAPSSSLRAAGSSGLSAKDAWQRLLAFVKDRDRRLHAVLVEARLNGMESGTLTLTFPSNFSWHFERFQKEAEALDAMAREALGEPFHLVATLETVAVDAPSPRQEHRAFVHRAENLFSGRVVDDSPV